MTRGIVGDLGELRGKLENHWKLLEEVAICWKNILEFNWKKLNLNMIFRFAKEKQFVGVVVCLLTREEHYFNGGSVLGNFTRRLTKCFGLKVTYFSRGKDL